MEPVEATEPGQSGPPKWVMPAVIGVVAVLLIGVGIFALRDDGSSEVASVTAPTTIAPTTVPATTAVPTTIAQTTVPTTVPATTAAPTTIAPTTIAPTTVPATAAPTTEPVTTAPLPDGQLAADVSTLAPGQASIATADGVITMNEVASCRVTPTVGFNVYSYLLTGDPARGPVLLEIGIDEGAAPFVTLSELKGELEGFNGQDNSAGSYWSGEFEGVIGEPTNQLPLTPLGGFAEGNANVSFHFTSDTEGCATGMLAEPWPFGPDENPQFIDDPFSVTFSSAYGFAVLGACDDEGNTLLLGEAGILSSFEFDGQLLPSIQLFSQTDSPVFLSRSEQGPNEQFVEQQGGGGDVLYAARVTAFDGSDPRYLSWTQPPTNVTGGLPVVGC